jgi:hypothetical protein
MELTINSPILKPTMRDVESSFEPDQIDCNARSRVVLLIECAACEGLGEWEQESGWDHRNSEPIHTHHECDVCDKRGYQVSVETVNNIVNDFDPELYLDEFIQMDGAIIFDDTERKTSEFKKHCLIGIANKILEKYK